jgi:hypothetical protein
MARPHDPKIAEQCRQKFDKLYDPLVAVARRHGYALAVHGSLARDIDLVAIPWIVEADEPEILAEAIRMTAATLGGLRVLETIRGRSQRGILGSQRIFPYWMPGTQAPWPTCLVVPLRRGRLYRPLSHATSQSHCADPLRQYDISREAGAGACVCAVSPQASMDGVGTSPHGDASGRAHRSPGEAKATAAEGTRRRSTA